MRSVIAALLTLAIAAPASAQTVIPLWAKGQPGFEARRDIPEQHADWWWRSINNPSLTVFAPAAGKNTGTAVIVVPGGGHQNLVFHAEGEAPGQYLAGIGVTGRRVFNDDGTKANFYATIGPMERGGVVLSGHSDVVPVDGQPWTSDPWRLTRRGDRLLGRGTCDMKGFLALSLALAPHVARRGMVRPLHLAISYDEEVGCLGAPSMIRRASVPSAA